MDRDGAEVDATLTAFRRDGRFAVGSNRLTRATNLILGGTSDDDATVATIRRVRAETGELLDPHTAVGVGAAELTKADRDPAVPLIALACAHPAKFAEAIERAVGTPAPLPERMADLMTRPERNPVIPNDLGALQDYIRNRVDSRGAAA